MRVKITKIICMTALCLMVLAGMTPVRAHALGNPVTFTVNQVAPEPSLALGESEEPVFLYKLTPADPGSPMPAGSMADGYVFMVCGSVSIDIGPLYYDREGVYRYKLFQVIEDEDPGIVYDMRVYTLEVHVNARLDAAVVALNEDGTKADLIVFDNGEEAEDPGTEPPTDPEGEKPKPDKPGSGSSGGNAAPGGDGGIKGKTPKTGDAGNPALYLAWLMASGMAAAFILILLAKRRKRKEAD